MSRLDMISAYLTCPGEIVSSSHRFSVSSFSRAHPAWGYSQFMERSIPLKRDSFQFRCDISVINEVHAESPAVPPPELHLHLGALLESKIGGDVTFDVGGEQFTAHRYLLAARSSVLMAQLFGSMKEKDMAVLRIDDMEERMFAAMLYFIYIDSLPEIDEGDEIGMGQHLLVAKTDVDL